MAGSQTGGPRAQRPHLIVLALSLAAALPSVVSAQEAPDAKEPKKSSKEKEPDPSSKMPGWLSGKEVQYFRMPPYNIPIIRAGQVIGQATVGVTLETRNIGNKEKILENRVRLQGAFLRDLQALASLDNGSGRAINAGTVKARLQRVADRVLGGGIITDILIDNVYTRRFD